MLGCRWHVHRPRQKVLVQAAVLCLAGEGQTKYISASVSKFITPSKLVLPNSVFENFDMQKLGSNLML